MNETKEGGFKIDNKVLIAIIVVMSFILLKQYRTNVKQKRLFTQLVGTETEFKKLKEENGLLKNKYVEQQKLSEKAKQEFGENAKVLESRIKVLSDATFLMREKARELGVSDAVFNGKFANFVLNEIRFNDGPAVGYVLIFKDGKVVSKMYDHEIKVTTAVSRNETTGSYKILTHADYILKSPSLNQGKNWYGVPYRLKIKDGEALIDPTEPLNLKKSFMWAPRLNMNAVFKPQPQFGLSVSLAGYGYSKNDLDYKFLDLGVAYDHKKDGFNPTLMPVLFRPIPSYLPNTYIGPGVMMDQGGQKYFGGLQVGF